MSFPSSPFNGQTATINNINYVYNSVNSAWTRLSTPVQILNINDISNQFDGTKAVFELRTDQSNVISIVDSKNVEVVVGGLRLTPYVKDLRYPWITPYDSHKGYRIVSSNTSSQVIIYNPPDIGEQAFLTIINSSSVAQTKRYPYSAATIALGD